MSCFFLFCDISFCKPSDELKEINEPITEHEIKHIEINNDDNISSEKNVVNNVTEVTEVNEVIE